MPVGNSIASYEKGGAWNGRVDHQNRFRCALVLEALRHIRSRTCARWPTICSLWIVEATVLAGADKVDIPPRQVPTPRHGQHNIRSVLRSNYHHPPYGIVIYMIET